MAVHSSHEARLSGVEANVQDMEPTLQQTVSGMNGQAKVADLHSEQDNLAEIHAKDALDMEFQNIASSKRKFVDLTNDDAAGEDVNTVEEGDAQTVLSQKRLRFGSPDDVKYEVAVLERESSSNVPLNKHLGLYAEHSFLLPSGKYVWTLDGSASLPVPEEFHSDAISLA